MHKRETLFLLAYFPQPAAIPTVELKLMKVLPRHLHRNLKSILIGYSYVGGWRKSQVTPHLNALDYAGWLKVSVRVNQHHLPHQRPIRVRGKLRDGRIQLQHILGLIRVGPGESVRLVSPQMIGPREGA